MLQRLRISLRVDAQTGRVDAKLDLKRRQLLSDSSAQAYVAFIALARTHVEAAAPGKALIWPRDGSQRLFADVVSSH